MSTELTSNAIGFDIKYHYAAVNLWIGIRSEGGVDGEKAHSADGKEISFPIVPYTSGMAGPLELSTKASIVRKPVVHTELACKSIWVILSKYKGIDQRKIHRLVRQAS